MDGDSFHTNTDCRDNQTAHVASSDFHLRMQESRNKVNNRRVNWPHRSFDHSIAVSSQLYRLINLLMPKTWREKYFCNYFTSRKTSSAALMTRGKLSHFSTFSHSRSIYFR